MSNSGEEAVSEMVTSNDITITEPETRSVPSQIGSANESDNMSMPVQVAVGDSNVDTVSSTRTTLDTVTNFFHGLLTQYQEALSNKPLETKMYTSCVVSLLGEVIGSSIKQSRYRGLMAANKNNNRYTVANMPPVFDLKRLAIFGVYGLALTGPIFHWWYGFLEKTVRSWNIVGTANVLTKIALDRLVLTPPFLLLTLIYMQFMQSFNMAKTSAAVKNIYASALYLNWRVWTPAQAVNFKFVPLEYRVLFGNLVALWWNIALSLKN